MGGAEEEEEEALEGKEEGWKEGLTMRRRGTQREGRKE